MFISIHLCVALVRSSMLGQFSGTKVQELFLKGTEFYVICANCKLKIENGIG